MADVNDGLAALAEKFAQPAFEAASKAAQFSVLGDFLLAGSGVAVCIACAIGLGALYGRTKNEHASEGELVAALAILAIGLFSFVGALSVLARPLYWAALFNPQIALAAKVLGWL